MTCFSGKILLLFALLPKLMSGEIRVNVGQLFHTGKFIYKYGLLINMSRSIQTSSSVRKESHNFRHAIRPKRIADVVGLRILADEDGKETRAELNKINKDTLDRLEKSYK